MKIGITVFYRMRLRLLMGLIFTVIIMFPGRNALALRCGSSLVEMGDRKYEVRQLCGEPLFIEKWTDETVLYHIGKKRPGDVNISRISTAQIEEWTYNFGPMSFLRFLRFVNGKLRKIEDGIKGFSGEMPQVSDRSGCGSRISRGDRKVEVLVKCGEPDMRELFGEDRISTTLGRLKRERIFQRHDLKVEVEEWTYDFGPLSFLFFIRFENGRVARTESGDYGF